jgi:hypothetical protein
MGYGAGSHCGAESADVEGNAVVVASCGGTAGGRAGATSGTYNNSNKEDAESKDGEEDGENTPEGTGLQTMPQQAKKKTISGVNAAGRRGLG